MSFPVGSQSELALLEPTADDIICVSALPPFAFSAAAKLCMQLRNLYPNPKILAGIWGFPTGREAMLQRLEKSSRTMVATTFTQALEQTSGAGSRPALVNPEPSTLMTWVSCRRYCS